MGYVVAIIAFLAIIFAVNKLWCFRSRSKVCLVGKTAIVTGGASGFGYETALALAANGCRVIIPVRDLVRSSKEVEKIIKETQNHNIIVKVMDLQSFKSVREFAEDILATEDRLDILICNAGIGVSEDNKKTEEGLQITMQTNYFSHFLLTHLLLDLLKKSSPSRIILTSSFMAYLSDLTIDTLNPKPGYFQKLKTRIRGGYYSNSKLIMVAAVKIFAEKLQGTGVVVNAVHPGLVRTPIFYKGFKYEQNVLALLFGAIAYVFGKTPEEGAQSLIHLAKSSLVEKISGRFFAEGIIIPMPTQLSDDMCSNLWKKSIEYSQLEAHEIKC